MNYYAQAIDVLETLNHDSCMRAVVVAFAKKHPKSFLDAVESVTADWKVEARILYQSGHRVQAIRYCRELTGMSLIDSKDAVEAL